MPPPDRAARQLPDVHTTSSRVTPQTLLPAVGVSVSAFLLFGAHLRPLGYIVLLLSLGAASVLDRPLAKDLLLIGIGISIISTTSVAADVSWDRFLAIGTALTVAVAVPFLIDRLVYRRRAIRFPWRGHRRWPTSEKVYLAAVPLLGWVILPYYF
ncbi:MAG: CPBP family intramembrane metalloprotease, partial [Actinobacteria bacterium]|nr:CPBP family intramembrane metalloprotease [Actinomycetota bacterium]